MSIVPQEVVVDAPAAWNAQADEFNQWDELGEDEKLEWTANRAAAWALEQAARRFDEKERRAYDLWKDAGQAYYEGVMDAMDEAASEIRAMIEYPAPEKEG